jgi:Lrp/AsnC family transcriptional regulator, leucine-responsive regulatory protein
MTYDDLDKIDKAILNALQKNARITHKDLAKELNMTTTPVFERVKKLEKNGFIKNVVALVDPSKVKKHLAAYLSIKLTRHSKGELMNFETALKKLNDVQECYHMAGSTDYLVKVVVRDMQEFQKFIVEKLSSIENIGQIDTMFMLREIKHETGYDVV